MPPTAGVVAPSLTYLAEQIAARMRAYNDNPNHPDLVGHPEGNPVQIRPAFPDAATFTKRLVEGVSTKASHYAEGVRAPRANFLDRAKASGPAWTAGVNAAVAGNRYTRRPRPTGPRSTCRGSGTGRRRFSASCPRWPPPWPPRSPRSATCRRTATPTVKHARLV